jgi:hypothetical protein
LRSCLRICKDKNFAAEGRFHHKIIITTSCFLILRNSAGSLSDLLVQSTKHLSQLYPIAQISKEKILRIEGQSPDFTVTTNKNTYKSKIIVVVAQQILFNWWVNVFVEPHQNHCQKNKESITQYRSQSGWRHLRGRNSCGWRSQLLLQRAVAPQ